MIKHLLIAALICSAGFSASAQYERERPRQPETYSDPESFGNGFQKEHLFIGGDLGLGYSTYSFGAGLSPEFGYSVSQWLDVGVLVNLNYNSIRANEYNNFVRQRSFNYGTGLFARVYPLPFLFLQVRPEYNWIDYNIKYTNSSAASESYHVSAASLLVGVGYGQRLVGRSNFNLSLNIDLLNNTESPYRDQYGTVIPVLKAGFDIYLHPRRH